MKRTVFPCQAGAQSYRAAEGQNPLEKRQWPPLWSAPMCAGPNHALLPSLLSICFSGPSTFSSHCVSLWAHGLWPWAVLFFRSRHCSPLSASLHQGGSTSRAPDTFRQKNHCRKQPYQNSKHGQKGPLKWPAAVNPNWAEGTRHQL